jgi:predicted N-acetyltransferase YhbS
MAAISRATYADIPAIWAVQQAAFRPEADYLKLADTVPLRETIEDIQNGFASAVILKAVDESGAIIGTVRGVPEDDSTVTVHKLAVNPQNQRSGIGRRLILALEAEFPGKNFELTVSDTYLQNGTFYQSVGYAQTGRSLDDGGIPILHMRKAAPA